MTRTPLLLVALLGCGVPQASHYVVGIDPAFTPSARATVLLALANWEAATDGEVTFEVGGEPDIRVHASNFAQADAIAPGSLDVTVTRGSESDAYIVDLDLVPVEHEIGHTIGLHHTGAGTVMCAAIGCQPSAISCPDAQQYERAHGLFERPCP